MAMQIWIESGTLFNLKDLEEIIPGCRALTEVAQLRERIAELEELCRTQTGLLAEARAENQRLREAGAAMIDQHDKHKVCTSTKQMAALLED